MTKINYSIEYKVNGTTHWVRKDDISFDYLNDAVAYKNGLEKQSKNYKFRIVKQTITEKVL